MNKTEHLLTCLSEECAEVQKATAKALRFGLNDGYPGGNTTNAQDIANECVDIVALIDLLQDEGIIPKKTIGDAIAKKAKVLRHLEHAKERGTLTSD